MRKRRTRSGPETHGEPSPPDAHATEYEALTQELVRLRHAVAEGGRRDSAPSVTQDEHAALEHALATAVTRAFVADAAGATPPAGVRTWVGEGLARSREREVAMLDAGHLIAVPSTRPAAGPR